MIRALGVKGDGKLSLVLGLTDRDMGQLKDGQAITINLNDIPFPEDGQNMGNVTITLIYGRDEMEIEDRLRTLMVSSSGNN